MNPSNKPPQGDNLSELEVVTSRHPQLTPDHPLEVLWDYYAGPETFYHGDVHYVLQLSIVRHGQIEIAYENHRRTCRSGDLWWTFCWEPHAFRCLDKRNLIMTVNVNLDDLGEIGLLGSSVNWLAPFSATPDKRYCPRTDDERDFIQKWADHMTHVYRRRPSNWLPQCWLDFHRLLLHVINRLPENTGTQENASDIRSYLERLRPALELVRTSPVTPDLKTAASVCHLSVSRFSELFRKALGKSYGHFALRAKLGHCAADLKNGKFLLKEIAQRHGFCDAAGLCNAFQRVFHCTPTEFKA